MPTFITTGNYSAAAMQGMIAKPSDRKAATKKLIEAAGGKLIDFYLTSGDRDFMIISEAKDGTDILPALMAAGASGATTNLSTIRAYSSADFLAAQKKAAELAKAYKKPG